ncbi:nitroreductase family protein [Bradyrhizobium sp. JR3.5]
MLTYSKLDTMTAIYQRRAVRSFAPEIIERATIEQLLHAAVHAPTAFHLEPWAFVVIQDKKLLRRYSDRAKALLLGQQEATSHFQKAEPQAMQVISDPEFNIFYDAGTLIVICCKAKGPFVDADCWLAAENLMLAATAQGLGTCCIGFAVSVLNTPEVKAELGIPEDGAAVAPIIVGIPSEPQSAGVRKPPMILSWTP